MSSEAAAFVGTIPKHYDAGLGPVIFADFADDLARRVASDAPSRVLETAAGTGILTRRLRDLLPATTYLTATDLNPPMLEVARAKFRPGEQVDFRPADATALPFPGGSFDAIASQFGLMFFPDRNKAHREAHRVLAPRGRYHFSVWDSHRHNPFGRIAHEIVAGFFPADPPQFYRVPFICHEIDPIKEALIDSGFIDIAISVVGMRAQIPDMTAFSRGIVYGNPLIDQIQERGGVAPDRIVDAMTNALRRQFGDEPACMPLQAIIYSAAKP